MFTYVDNVLERHDIKRDDYTMPPADDEKHEEDE